MDELTTGGTLLREGRREMVTGVSKRTLYGDILIKIKVDMPGRVSEDEFKRTMIELGEIMKEAFSK
jgi:hypothetical protein